MNFTHTNAEWKKSDTKKYTLCDSIYRATLIYLDRRQMFPTLAGRGIREGLGMWPPP